jgi:hypothetical protein
MSFSRSELAQLAVTFPKEYAEQIKAKSAKHRMPQADISQTISLIILEKGEEFDPTKGTFVQFVFGHFEKRMRRQLGAHTFAISLDSDDILGEDTRTLIEMAALSDDDSEQLPLLSDQPGVAKILAIARFLSGKSISDVARILEVTPRRVRQMLQQIREKKTIPIRFEAFLNMASPDENAAGALQGKGRKIAVVHVPTALVKTFGTATLSSGSATYSNRVGL